jgi:hypothetical protein
VTCLHTAIVTCAPQGVEQHLYRIGRDWVILLRRGSRFDSICAEGEGYGMAMRETFEIGIMYGKVLRFGT